MLIKSQSPFLALNYFNKRNSSINLLHQNRRALQKQFQLTVNHVYNIILKCPDCQAIAFLPQTGRNSRGTVPVELW